MNEYRSRIGLLCLMAALVCGAAACGGDKKKSNTQQNDEPDVIQMDVDPEDESDAEEEDANEDEPDVEEDFDPEVTEGVVTVDGATVRVSFEPFRLTVEDQDGQVRASARVSGELPFAGIAFARAEEYRDTVYYIPADAANQREPLRWFRVDRLKEGTQDGDRFVFTVTSVDEDEARGPDVQVILEPTEHAVALRVVLDDDPALVYNSFNLEARPGEGYYGFGEMFDQLDGRGLIRHLVTQAEQFSESATNEVHVPVPLMLSTERYGLFVDDLQPLAMDLGATVEDAARVTSLSRNVTYLFMVKDDPMDIVERYTDITGKPAHVPFWSLAPQWWRNVTADADEVLEDAVLSRQLDMPSTVMWIDRPWSSFYHNWRFDTVRFPEPELLFEELHDIGYRVLLHHSPHVNPNGQTDDITGVDDSENLFDLFVDNEWVVTTGGRTLLHPWGGGNGAYIDFSNPEAVEAVHEHIRRVTDLGAIGTKMDWDEGLQPNIASIRLNAEFHDGQTLLTMRSQYSALYHKAIKEGFDRGLGEPSFHVNRSGSPGDQVFNTCIWPGDLDNDLTPHTRGPSDFQERWNVGGMPSAMVANQSLGMSGYPCFASDIGGFRNGQPVEEHLMRWMAFGVFNAIMQIGGGGGSHMPWTSDSVYSAEAIEITRKYMKLRMRLIPYIFHHLLIAERTGRPLVRSLWLAYPDDAEGRQHEDDFLFGPDIFIAPVYIEGAEDREFYLPPGQWVDFWTGQASEGSQTLTQDTPIDHIPIFVRAGAIIPTYAHEIDTLMPAPNDEVISLEDKPDIRFLLVPGAEGGQMTLYNGVAIATNPSEGAFEVTLTQEQVDPEVDPRMAQPSPTLSMDVMLGGAAFGQGPQVTAERDGQPLVLTQSEDEACTDCWRLLPDTSSLRVVLSGPAVVRIAAE